jgi:Bacterial toxin 5
MGITPEQEQQNLVLARYTGFKAIWCYGLPELGEVLTDDQIDQIQKRIAIMWQIVKTANARGDNIDAGVLAHVIGDLTGRVKMNERLKWNALPQAEKDLQNALQNHPEWRIRGNLILDSIVDQSMSTDVQLFQAAVIGTIIHMAMPTTTRPPPVTIPKPIPVLSKIAAFVGTRDAFRGYVLKKLISEPNNPLRFLLNKEGTGWNTVTSRSHAVLIDRYDIWEAGHIMSDKIGGVRLMIQTAWENQIQGQSVERPSIGGAALDNPAVEIGGLPVARSTVKTWELAGKLPSGTADRAPIIVK